MADGCILRQLGADRLERGFLLGAREADVALEQRCQAVLRCSSAVLESVRQRQKRHRTCSSARSCVGVGRSFSW
jgi:hypothetical protein